MSAVASALLWWGLAWLAFSTLSGLTLWCVALLDGSLASPPIDEPADGGSPDGELIYLSDHREQDAVAA